ELSRFYNCIVVLFGQVVGNMRGVIIDASRFYNRDADKILKLIFDFHAGELLNNIRNSSERSVSYCHLMQKLFAEIRPYSILFRATDATHPRLSALRKLSCSAKEGIELFPARTIEWQHIKSPDDDVSSTLGTTAAAATTPNPFAVSLPPCLR